MTRRPLILNQNDNEFSLIKKMNQNFARLWVSISDLTKASGSGGGNSGSSGGGSVTGYTHTSSMPDIAGVNQDHDYRYMYKHPVLAQDGTNVVDLEGNLVVMDNR